VSVPVRIFARVSSHVYLSFLSMTGAAPSLFGTIRRITPAGAAMDSTGNVFVADYLNNRVTKGMPLLQFERSTGSLIVSNGFFQMRLIGPSGNTMVVETSSNFATWTSIQTNALPPFGLDVSLPLSTNQNQVVRARLVP